MTTELTQVTERLIERTARGDGGARYALREPQCDDLRRKVAAWLDEYLPSRDSSVNATRRRLACRRLWRAGLAFAFTPRCPVVTVSHVVLDPGVFGPVRAFEGWSLSGGVQRNVFQ